MTTSAPPTSALDAATEADGFRHLTDGLLNAAHKEIWALRRERDAALAELTALREAAGSGAGEDDPLVILKEIVECAETYKARSIGGIMGAASIDGAELRRRGDAALAAARRAVTKAKCPLPASPAEAVRR